MEVVVTTGAKTCKAPVRSSPSTNQQAGCPYCRPTNSVKALKGEVPCFCMYVILCNKPDWYTSWNWCWCASPICPHCGEEVETAEHLFHSCCWWDTEHWRHFGGSTDVTDVFEDYQSVGQPHLIGTSTPHSPPPHRAMVHMSTTTMITTHWCTLVSVIF